MALPERLVSVKDNIIITNPIAVHGQRKNKEEDSLLAKELLADEKKELNMYACGFRENDVERLVTRYC